MGRTELFLIWAMLLTWSLSCGEPENGEQEYGPHVSIFPGIGVENIRLGSRLDDYYPGLSELEQIKRLDLRKIVVVFGETDQITAILSADPGMVGPNGLGVGSPKAQVIAEYGEPGPGSGMRYPWTTSPYEWNVFEEGVVAVFDGDKVLRFGAIPKF